MVRCYQDIRKVHGYRAKVFAKENGAIMKRKIGAPDLMLVFTGTVSYKMVITAHQEAERNNVPMPCGRRFITGRLRIRRKADGTV